LGHDTVTLLTTDWCSSTPKVELIDVVTAQNSIAISNRYSIFTRVKTSRSRSRPR